MDERDRDDLVDADMVRRLAAATDLTIGSERANALAPLLADARRAGARLASAAARIPLAEAMEFDPAWNEQGRGR